MEVCRNSKQQHFIADTYVNEDHAGTVGEDSVMAAEAVRRFGIEPKVALLSRTQLWFLRPPAKCGVKTRASGYANERPI